jgi:hypothetical protein
MKPKPGKLKLSDTLEGKKMASYSPDGITEYAGYGYTAEDAIINLASAIIESRNNESIDNMPEPVHFRGLVKELTQQPSVGRIVHFICSDNVRVPAIITKVHNATCVNLRVFFNCNTPETDQDFFNSSTFDNRSDATYGTWCWPPKLNNV